MPDAFRTAGALGDDGFRAPTILNPETRLNEGLRAGNPITKQYDFNVGIGGPVIKGKLWFYLGYRDNNQYKTILGLPGEEAQSQLVNYTAKLTYQINPKNQIIAFFNQRTKLQPLRDLSLQTPVETAYYQASRNRPMKLEWTSVLSDRLFLDVQAALLVQRLPALSQPDRERVDRRRARGPARPGHQPAERGEQRLPGPDPPQAAALREPLLLQGRLGPRQPRLQVRLRGPARPPRVPVLPARGHLLPRPRRRAGRGGHLEHAQQRRERLRPAGLLPAGQLGHQPPVHRELRRPLRPLQGRLPGTDGDTQPVHVLRAGAGARHRPWPASTPSARAWASPGTSPARARRC